MAKVIVKINPKTGTSTFEVNGVEGSKCEEVTEALVRNAQNFDFMRQLINVPSNFIMPAPAYAGGGLPGGGVTIQITTTVSDSDEIKTAVYDALSEAYSDSYRIVGRR